VPGCLVLDSALPRLNGLDLHKHLATNRKGIPAIFVTDRRGVAEMVQVMKAGERHPDPV